MKDQDLKPSGSQQLLLSQRLGGSTKGKPWLFSALSIQLGLLAASSFSQAPDTCTALNSAKPHATRM